MTSYPLVIDARASLADADALMTANGFRHLPVVRENEAIGVISDVDLRFARGLKGVKLGSMVVEDAIQSELYAVAPDTPVDVVAETMAMRRAGSALIIEGSRIVGIFTTTDALHVIRDWCRLDKNIAIK